MTEPCTSHVHTFSEPSDTLTSLVSELQGEINDMTAHADALGVVERAYMRRIQREYIEQRDEYTAELAQRAECGATFA